MIINFWAVIRRTLCRLGLHWKVTVYSRPSHDRLKCTRCGAEWVDDMFGFVSREK